LYRPIGRYQRSRHKESLTSLQLDVICYRPAFISDIKRRSVCAKAVTQVVYIDARMANILSAVFADFDMTVLAHSLRENACLAI